MPRASSRASRAGWVSSSTTATPVRLAMLARRMLSMKGSESSTVAAKAHRARLQLVNEQHLCGKKKRPYGNRQ